MVEKLKDHRSPQTLFWLAHGEDDERPLEDCPGMAVGSYLFVDGAIDGRASEFGPANERMFYEPPEDPERLLRLKIKYHKEKTAIAGRAFDGRTQSLLNREEQGGETSEADFKALNKQRSKVVKMRKTLDAMEAEFDENFLEPDTSAEDAAREEKAQMKLVRASDKRKQRLYSIEI